MVNIAESMPFMKWRERTLIGGLYHLAERETGGRPKLYFKGTDETCRPLVTFGTSRFFCGDPSFLESMVRELSPQGANAVKYNSFRNHKYKITYYAI